MRKKILLISIVFISFRTIRCRFSNKVPKNEDAIDEIIHYLTQGGGRGKGYEWLANLTDTFGNRKLGSRALEKAIDFLKAQLTLEDFDNVHTETVENLPNWVRKEEKATLYTLERPPYNMGILGVGNTVPTPEKGIFAEAIVVRSFKELDELGKAGRIKGKIVVYNQDWVDYGTSVQYRSGQNQASRWGAVAALIRSVASFSVYSPHTGMTSYDKYVPHIPAACITVEDAEMMFRMQKRGQKLLILLKILSTPLPNPITSENTVFELRGREKPNEVIILSGHLDSWDVGEGAMDDGGGIAVMWHAVSALRALGLRPKRTIRVVFWTAEEFGHLGGHAYYKRHKHNQNVTLIAVSESDMGVFKPTSSNATIQVNPGRNRQFLDKMKMVQRMINQKGIPLSVTESDTDYGDVNGFVEDGVPGFQYLNKDMYNHYFIFHHTNADMMTVFKPEDIDYTAAVFASFAYSIANDF